VLAGIILLQKSGGRVVIPPISHSAILPSSTGIDEEARRTQISETYGKLPLSFEENRGQVDAKVKFLSRGRGYNLFLSPTEAVFALHAQATTVQTRRVLRMKLVGTNPSPEVTGLEELPGKSNYFIGSDPARWRTNVATYARVKYRDVYPGIDLVYYGNQRQLEYDWIISPGAEPGAIRFAIEGAKRIKVDSSGDLVLAIAGGEVRLHKPVVYQETEGVRHEIAGGFVSPSNHEVAFSIADYDRTRPLVIDPILIYSTYLGGSGDDFTNGIAVDSSGSVYVTGSTSSTNFPTANPLQPASGGGSYDAFVTKFNPSGSALVYSTYLGGSGDDSGNGIALDSSGNAYVTGSTSSTNFPTANPLQPASGGGSYDAFVTKFNSSGSVLVYSTYHGGAGEDKGLGVALDSSGDAHVTGSTLSTNFPTASPLQPAHGGGAFTDAFVTKFNPSGSTLVYSTYHGGSRHDTGNAIAVDGSGNAYLTGTTRSTNFPTANPRQPALTYIEYTDAFVTKFNPSGNALVYSTYHGGFSDDYGQGIAVDPTGNAYVTGYTSSSDFPTVKPLQPIRGGDFYDAFVTKFNSSGGTLVYSTYHGGSGNDTGHSIAIDSSGNAFVTGYTFSTNFPTANPLQPAIASPDAPDAYVTKFNQAGSALVYSTYHGGNSHDSASGIAVDSADRAYVTGKTGSTNFPMANPFQPVNAGGINDAFVSKIGETLPILKITMSKDIYVNGEVVTATGFRLENPGSMESKAELAVWLKIPGMNPVSILKLGADSSFILPPNFSQELGPFPLFTVNASFARGSYAFSSRMVNPVTEKFLSEDLNVFLIQ
jgi:hypothetical protein